MSSLSVLSSDSFLAFHVHWSQESVTLLKAGAYSERAPGAAAGNADDGNNEANHQHNSRVPAMGPHVCTGDPEARNVHTPRNT